MLPVCILAGGLATRLRPLTETTPKALVDLAGRPFIDWQLHYLKGQGISDVVICAGYLGEQIEQCVGDGSNWGLSVRFAFDGDALLGTGGAIRRALHMLGDDFFILYGDSYLPVNFASVGRNYFRQQKPALMTVLRNGGQWDRSNVLFKDGELVEYNKAEPGPEMDYIDYGLGVMRASVLSARPAGQAFDLAEVYQELSLKGQLAGHEVHERFYEIGSHQGLFETIQYLKKNGAPGP